MRYLSLLLLACGHGPEAPVVDAGYEPAIPVEYMSCGDYSVPKGSTCCGIGSNRVYYYCPRHGKCLTLPEPFQYECLPVLK